MSPISSPPPESTTDGGESVASTRLTSIDEALRGFLDDHVLFKNLDETFINTVAASMQTRVYGDSAYIIRQGEVGRALFFILKGEVEIVSEDGETVINVMKEQSFFGEVGVLFSVPRTASCRARGRCILATLTKDALQAAVVDHPEAADRIRTIAEERFSSYLKQKERKVLVEFGQELALGMTQSDLKKIPLFRECSVGFLHLLTFKLSPIQFRQNDNIIKKGDAASEMYFIVHGTAAVFNEADGTIFAEFHPGSFFGEVGIFFDVKRTASVRCLTNTAAVFKLTKVDLDGLLKQFPEVNALIQKEAQARLQYDEERRKLAKQHEHTEIEVVRDKIRSVSLFRNADLGFLHQLALQIKMVVCQAGQVIIRKGDQGSSMFFVLEGTAEVVSEDGKQVFAEFHTNGYFGEVALVLDVERTATVRSRGRTTLGELHKNTLDGVLEQYPEFKANLQASAQQSYEQFRKRQQNVEKMGAAKEAFEIEASASRLKQVPMFQNCDDAFLRAMALATFPRQALDGDIVVHQGETSSEMFFVVRGQVQIVSEDGGTVYDTVPSGGFFGEIGLLKNIPRTASVRIASPSCDLMVLTSAALDSVCKQYPESYQTIVVEANRRMEKIEQRQSSRDDLSVRATEGPATVAADGAETERLKSLWDDAAASVKKSVEAQKARDQMHSLAGKAEPEIKTPNRPSSFGRIFYTRQQKAEVPETKGTSSKIASPELVTPGQSSENLTEVQKGAVPKRSSLVSSFLKSLRPGILKRSGSSKNHASTSSLGSEPDITTPVPVSRRQSTYAAPRPSAKPTLQELDAKIQRIILSYLDPITRLSMRCLCKYWNNSLRNPMHWEIVNFHLIFNAASAKTFVCFWELSGDHLAGLDMTSCWKLSDTGLQTMARMCPNLVYLSLSNCWKFTDAGLRHVTHGLRKLRELDISYCGQLRGTAFAGHKLHKLVIIDISYCKQLGDEQVESILSGTPLLKQLKCRRCIRLTDLSVFHVVRYCRDIYLVEASDCKSFTDRCLKWISSAQDLKCLSLMFCSRITNAGLYELSLGGQLFERLDFSYCSHLTDACVGYFAHNFRNLRFLSMRGCRAITDNTLKSLAKYARRLLVLDLIGCPLVTTKAKAELVRQLPAVDVRLTVPVVPLERKRPTELQLCDVFKSGPAEKMRRNFLVNGLPASRETSRMEQ